MGDGPKVGHFKASTFELGYKKYAYIFFVSAFPIDSKMTDHVQIIVLFNLGDYTTRGFADMENWSTIPALGTSEPGHFQSEPAQPSNEDFARIIPTSLGDNLSFFPYSVEGKTLREKRCICKNQQLPLLKPGDENPISDVSIQ